MSAPVFLGDPADLATARAGAVLTVRGPEARHAVSVRRVRAGEVVDVVDGEGTRARGEVTTAAGEELAVHVAEVTREPAPAVRLVLVQALAKGGRDEQAVETATEVGIDAVLPWQSERCVSVWAGKKAAKGRERWQAVALAATKQSRRARVPVVAPLASRQDLVRRVGAAALALVLHEEGTEPLSAVELPDTGEVLLVVGPEGGVSPQELEALAAAGARTVRLGTTVLRTSTAGPAALALLNARSRWR